MTAALEGGEWSAARLGRTLPPGKTRYPLHRRLGGPQGRSGRAENLVPNGIRSRTVQPGSSVAIPTELPGPQVSMNNYVTDPFLYVTTITETLNPGKFWESGLSNFTSVIHHRTIVCWCWAVCSEFSTDLYTTYNVTAVPGNEVTEFQTRATINPSCAVKRKVPDITHTYSTGKMYNNNTIYLLQLGCHPVAMVILHVNKTWNWLLKLNSVALVRTRTIPTERPPPVGEVSANFCG